MRNEDIRPCEKCGGQLRQENGLMCGATITVQRHHLDPQNANALMGLSTILCGSRTLAQVFAPGEAIKSPKELRSEHLVCETCLMSVMGVLPEDKPLACASGS